MTTWLTESEAADFLRVPEKALKNARYRKKVKARKICGVVQYMQEWLDEFREGTCEERQSSASGMGHHTGISHSRKEEGLSAIARARLIVSKQKESWRSTS